MTATAPPLFVFGQGYHGFRYDMSVGRDIANQLTLDHLRNPQTFPMLNVVLPYVKIVRAVRMWVRRVMRPLRVQQRETVHMMRRQLGGWGERKRRRRETYTHKWIPY